MNRSYSNNTKGVIRGAKSVHEYNVEFMRLAERDNLREREGQQVTRYLEGLKPQIKHMIGVQVMRNLHEAKNMALKAEFIEEDMSLLGGISMARILGHLVIMR